MRGSSSTRQQLNQIHSILVSVSSRMFLTLPLIKWPQFPVGNPPTADSCLPIGIYKRGEFFHCVVRVTIRLANRNISDWSKNSEELVSYQLLFYETSRVWLQFWRPNSSTSNLSKSSRLAGSTLIAQECWGLEEIWLEGETEVSGATFQ